jgi:hypothetical protein
MSSHLLAIKSSDAVMLYNLTRDSFLAKPSVEIKGNNLLTGFPVLTSKPSEVGTLIIGDAPRESAPLDIGEHFTLRTSDTLLKTGVFLGIDKTDPLTIASASQAGQKVYYQDSNDSRSVLWEAVSSQASHCSGELCYGVKYHLKNSWYHTHLMKSPLGNGRLCATIDAPFDEWVFIPTSQIFVCQDSVNLCAGTRGTDNAYQVFTCDEKQCVNRFHELVSFSDQQCNATCGTLVSSTVSSLSPSLQLSQSFVPLQKENSPATFTFKTILLVVVFLGVCFWISCFLLVKKQKWQLKPPLQ